MCTIPQNTTLSIPEKAFKLDDLTTGRPLASLPLPRRLHCVKLIYDYVILFTLCLSLNQAIVATTILSSTLEITLQSCKDTIGLRKSIRPGAKYGTEHKPEEAIRHYRPKVCRLTCCFFIVLLDVW